MHGCLERRSFVALTSSLLLLHPSDTPLFGICLNSVPDRVLGHQTPFPQEISKSWYDWGLRALSSYTPDATCVMMVGERFLPSDGKEGHT